MSYLNHTVYPWASIPMQDENNHQYGVDRFLENIVHLKGHSPKDFVKRFEKSISTFKGKAKQTDDITMMIVKYKS